MTNSRGNCSQHSILCICVIYSHGIAIELTLSNALKSKSECWRTENYYELKMGKDCVFEHTQIAMHLLVCESKNEADHSGWSVRTVRIGIRY